MPAQQQTDEFEQYARPAGNAGDDEFSQYARQPAAPTGVSATVDQPKTFADKNPRLMNDVHELEGMVKGVGQSLYQVSVPGIASSFFKEKFPSVAKHLPNAMTENAAPLEKLPGKIATTLPTLMMGDEVPPEARAGGEIPKPAPTEPSSTMGGRAAEVAKRRIGNLPGVRAVKDIDYIARGEKPAPTVAKPNTQPAPVPETNGVRWGTASDVPIAERGKLIPQSPPEVSSPSRTLPGMHSPEVISKPQIAKPSAEPIPARPGLMLKGEVADTSPKKVGNLLNDSLGGEPLKKNVPLKNQLRGIKPQPQGETMPAGHEPVSSSAIKSFKYDPATKEFEAVTTSGSHYIHGDISPEQAEAFQKAESKGKAWNDIRKNGTLVAKVVDGKRIAAKPPSALGSATPESEAPEPRIPGPNENMSKLGRQSLEMLQKRRGIAKPDQ